MKWDQVQHEAADVSAPALLAVTQALQATHVNGGVILKTYQPTDATAFDQAARNDRRGVPNLLRCFFEASSVRDSVPELQLPRTHSWLPRFTWCSVFEFEGAVTYHLLRGGAYKRSPLDEDTARQMSRDFVDALLGKGRTQASVWWTAEPWTPWFYDVAWDMTFVILQEQPRQWVLFCKTDTD